MRPLPRPHYIKAYREFSVSGLDQAVVEKIHNDWISEGTEGMRVFLDQWGKGLTFETAAKVVRDFGLKDKLGDPDTLEDRYQNVSAVFEDIETAINEGPVKTINDRSEVTWTDGPAYRAGNHDLNFGLVYEASQEDLTRLREKFPLTQEPQLQAASTRRILFRGAVYELVLPEQKTAYYLPEDIKGVETCKAKDVKDKSKDIWCVYDWKGRLRGRFKVKKDAVRHKVMMIRRFLGSDKAKRQNKYRPPTD